MIAKIAKMISEQGYSVIPVSLDKNPLIEILNYDSRTDKNIEKTFEKAKGIALRTGGDTMVTCIDIDEKYSVGYSVGQRYLDLIPNELKKKLKINQTKNGGLHIPFISDYIVSNTVLASRETTEEEVKETFDQAIKEGASFKEAVATAFQDRNRVLVETRGGKRNSFGGYFLIPPSEGYVTIQENPMPKLNKLETELLYNIGYSLCQNRRMNRKIRFGKNVYESANFKRFKEIDGSKVLLDYGWEEVDRDESKGIVRLKRPGKVLSKDSAIYNLDTKVFYCFSTSTCFIANEGYTNLDMLLELENTDTLRDVIPLVNKYINQ